MSGGLRFLVAVAGLLLAQAAGAQSLEPGRWRVVTATLSNPGSPPEVAMRCLTPEQVADLGTTFAPQVRTENSQCERTEFTLEPKGLTWRLQCKGQLDMDVSGQFIFSTPTNYSALILTKATMLERIVQQTMVSISAERVGECP
jgi:hypothetical protein